MSNIQAKLIFVLFAGYCTSTLADQVDGFLEPYKEIEIASPEPGLLSRVEVVLGERVKAEQLLAQLDRAEYFARVEIAASEMVFKGDLELTQAEVDLNESMVEKLQQLRTRDHATQHELERAENQLRIAKAKLLSTQEQKEILKLQHALAIIQLNKRDLKSPIDGIVTEIIRDPGEFISMNEPTVLRVVQLDPLLVVFSVPIDQVKSLAEGQTVDIRLDQPRQLVDGVIEYISPTANPQSGTTSVRVRVPNPGERYMSGGTCRLLLNDLTRSADKLASQTVER
ncbi:efflux RND transporter periplasmic adaptor subunit [Stieleria varia]|nr:efflux RND transporter periplasmic adaptor subunit [Stieleria varia]